MSLPSKLKLPDLYLGEMTEYLRIQNKFNRTTTGQYSFTSSSSGIFYTTLGQGSYDNGGENAMGLLLYNVNPILKNYIFDDTTYTEIKNTVTQLDYQPCTVVGTQIRVTKASALNVIKFVLDSDLTGGAITISTDGGASSIALKNGALEDVAELSAGLVEVAYVTPFFILRSGGGIKSFFGDGSDGTIPNLNLITTAPNGGTVANLWDMNTGTTFTTSSLGASADVVAFSIDFAKPVLMTNFRLWNASVGTNRTYAIQSSDDGIVWTQRATQAITTTPTSYTVAISNITARFWRLATVAGTAGVINIRSITMNYVSDLETALVWRILELSTLNGAAVIKQYTEYVLPVGYEHTVQNPCQGLIIYSQGDVTVNGIIDMSQKAGLAPNGNTIPMIMTDFKITDPYGFEMFNKLTTSLRNLKGGAGGNGGYGGGRQTGVGRASGGTGGAGRQNLGGFGGGGAGGSGQTYAFSFSTGGGLGGSIPHSEFGGAIMQPLKFNGNTLTSPQNTVVEGLNGLNGGGGYGLTSAPSSGYTAKAGKGGYGSGGGGGGGGGAESYSGQTTTSAQDGGYSVYAGGFIMLICGESFLNQGLIKANGSNGGSGGSGSGYGSGGGGGGGSGGGVIAIYYKDAYINDGTIQVNGGDGGIGGAPSSGASEYGGNGTSGSVGTIHTQQL